jgi:hypothetical protein
MAVSKLSSHNWIQSHYHPVIPQKIILNFLLGAGIELVAEKAEGDMKQHDIIQLFSKGFYIILLLHSIGKVASNALCCTYYLLHP